MRWLLLQGTGSRCAGSVVTTLGLSCPTACGIFLDQGLNPCPLHRQADSGPPGKSWSSEVKLSLLSRRLGPPVARPSDETRRVTVRVVGTMSVKWLLRARAQVVGIYIHT